MGSLIGDLLVTLVLRDCHWNMEQEFEDAELSLKKFAESFAVLKESVEPLLSTLDKLRSSDDNDDSDGLHRARLHIALCYSVNSLFCMYLRTQGVDPMTHPVSDEIVRVQEAFLRLRNVEAGQLSDQKNRKRSNKVDIVNAQLQAAKLASVVFPEATELLQALQNRHVRPGSIKFDPEDDDDDKCSKKSNDGEEEEKDKKEVEEEEEADDAAKAAADRKASKILKKRAKALAEAKLKKIKKKREKREKREKKRQEKQKSQTQEANGSETVRPKTKKRVHEEHEEGRSKRSKKDEVD